MTTWTLTAGEYAATKAHIDKINARAVKRGFTGTFTLTGVPTTWMETNDAGVIVERAGITASITGTPPCYGGWTFLAAVDTLENETGAQFVVRAAPGVPEGTIDRNMLLAGHCGHCGTNRRRKNTFLVHNETTGANMQVGSTCLKDFLGWDGSPVFTREADLEGLLDGAVGTGRPEYTTETVLATAWAAVAQFGWRPSAASGDSTRAVVEAALYGRGAKDRDVRSALAGHMQAGTLEAPKIIETLLATTGTSDYESNLRAVLASPVVEARHFGLAVSAVPAYQRTVNGARAEKAKVDTFEPKWLGKPGDKVTVEGNVVTAMTVDGFAYNTTSRLVVVRTATALIKIYSAAGWAYDVEPGEQVTLAGTVKALTDYQGQQQTQLTRVKRIDSTQAASA